ncbi:vitamin K epoxide reductase family protein [Geminocystis herdmanii]|uniref:vitamin K epoxide reductase family protein n=1 Tax=Geminocystis herdmanii TaxID=669359 RepID=UPI00034972B7|nr:vitamin K epoxide reductase family protein [Geminocystis herdmanii]
MIRRRRNLPWIQRQSRFIIGAIAIVGLILTIYLTLSKLGGAEIACTAGAGGCDSVLDSAYAYPFDPQGKTGPPLSILGSFAYLSMAIFALTPLFINPEKNKELRQKLEKSTWWLMVMGSFAMAAFSSYLMFVLAFKIQAVCPYCIGSALFSFSLLTLTIIGHEWEDMGQILFTGIAIALITLVSALGVYANVAPVITENPNIELPEGQKIPIPQAQTAPQPPLGWEITTTSGEAEIALAKHLAENNAVMYSAYWCPHCYDQKLLFGKEAFKEMAKVECDPKGVAPAPQKCIDAKVRAFPTWVIDGTIYEGVQSLEKLAELTGYTGNTDFKYGMR